MVYRNPPIVNGRKSVCPGVSAGIRFWPQGVGSTAMAAQSNIGGIWRTSYVLAGIALALWGLFGAEAAWARIVSLVFGGALLVEGVIGF